MNETRVQKLRFLQGKSDAHLRPVYLFRSYSIQDFMDEETGTRQRCRRCHSRVHISTFKSNITTSEVVGGEIFARHVSRSLTPDTHISSPAMENMFKWPVFKDKILSFSGQEYEYPPSERARSVNSHIPFTSRGGKSHRFASWECQ